MSFEQVGGSINNSMQKVSSVSQKLFDKTWDQVSGVWLFTWDSNGCVALHRSVCHTASTDVKHFFLSIFNFPYEDALSAFAVSNTLSGNRVVSLIDFRTTIFSISTTSPSRYSLVWGVTQTTTTTTVLKTTTQCWSRW